MGQRLVGVVADDLTGAMDAAVQFAVQGWPAHVLCHPDARPEVDGSPALLAVVTGVRAALDDEAVAATAAAVGALLARGCDRLYMKVDSTMRGSVAGQLRGGVGAWAGRFPGAILVLCPAFPAEGRVVVGGRLLVHGVPLDLSAAAADPVTPVVESRLDRLVPGATPGLPTDPGAAVVGAGQVPPIVFADASTDTDLDAIAVEVDRLGPHGVAAGAAGLAAALARLWAAGPRAATFPQQSGQRSARMLIGVSSLHPRTRESVERLRTSPVRQGGHGPTFVDVISTQARRSDPAATAAAFGGQVADQLARGSYDTLVLVGGDGAAAALDRLGVRAIRVRGALAPGVPVGTVLGGAAHGVRVVTKSGGFGRSDSLLRIVERLQSCPSMRKERS